MPLSKIRKGDTSRTMMHAHVANEVITEVNRNKIIKVKLPNNEEATITSAENGTELDLSQMTSGATLDPNTINVWYNGAPGYQDFLCGPPRSTPTP